MDILERISELRQERNWSEYQLAKHSGLTQSTISSWYQKNLLPSIPSLEKICDAFQISLSQFFREEQEISPTLTSNQKLLLDYCSKLSPDQIEALLAFLKTL